MVTIIIGLNLKLEVRHGGISRNTCRINLMEYIMSTGECMVFSLPVGRNRGPAHVMIRTIRPRAAGLGQFFIRTVPKHVPCADIRTEGSLLESATDTTIIVHYLIFPKMDTCIIFPWQNYSNGQDCYTCSWFKKRVSPHIGVPAEARCCVGSKLLKSAFPSWSKWDIGQKWWA